MHFIAMLGYTIPGEIIHYNVLITIGSMLIAVVVVGIGLLIVGFGEPGTGAICCSPACSPASASPAMHYTGMAAMRMPARMTYSPALFALSVVIAVVAATAALWAALQPRAAPAPRWAPR